MSGIVEVFACVCVVALYMAGLAALWLSWFWEECDNA